MNEANHIKRSIVTLINQENDPHILELVHGIFASGDVAKNEVMNHLNAAQRSELEHSIQESEDIPNLVSIAEAKSSLDRWLKK
jgi:hypothetical protein